MKHLVIQSPQLPSYFIPLGPRCLPQHPILCVLPEGGTISQKLMLRIALLNNEIMVIEFQVWCYASWCRVRSALYRHTQYTYCGRQDSHLVVHMTGYFL